jgi:hypothetical protein
MRGTHFTCFTGAKVQILTLRTRIRAADVFVTPAIAAAMLLVYAALN